MENLKYAKNPNLLTNKDIHEENNSEIEFIEQYIDNTL